MFAFIITSVKFQDKLMSAKCFLPKISCNKLSITLYLLNAATAKCVGEWAGGIGLSKLTSFYNGAFDRVREFSISSVLSILEIQHCLFTDSFNQINHSTVWWIVNIVSGVL